MPVTRLFGRFLNSYWYCLLFLDFENCKIFVKGAAQFYSNFIRAIVTKDGSCAPEIFYMPF